MQLNNGTGTGFSYAQGAPFSGTFLGLAATDVLSSVAGADFNLDGGADLLVVSKTNATVTELLSRYLTTSSLALTGGTTPASYGSTVSLTATALARIDPAGNSLGGTFQLLDNGVSVGAAQAINALGSASYSVVLAAGTHSLSARFASATGFAASTSNSLTVVINSAPPYFDDCVLYFRQPYNLWPTRLVRRDVLRRFERSADGIDHVLI